MTDLTLRYNLYGEDKTASSTIKGVGKTFESLGSKIGGELGDLFDKVGAGIDQLGEKGQKMGPKLMVAGAAVTAIGGALTLLGAKEKQATDQLALAIENAGGSVSDYEGQIERTVKAQENFGHSAVETKGALQILVQQSGDTQASLRNMGLVADLAAAKHISLADAAALVAKVLSGSGAKVLKTFGIAMDNNIVDPSQRAQVALDQLSQKVNGQASAAVDNWRGKLEVAKTKVEDFVSAVGQKAGPAIMAVGGIIEGFGIIMETKMIQKSVAGSKALLGIGDASVSMAGKVGRATAALGVLGAAVGVAIAVYNHFHKSNADAQAAMDSYTDAIKADTGAIGDNTRQQAIANLSKSKALDLAKVMGISLDDVTQATLGNADAMQRVEDRAKNFPIIGEQLVGSIKDQSKAINGQVDAYALQKEALDTSAIALKDQQSKQEGANSAAKDGATVAKAQADALDVMTAALYKLNGAQADALDMAVNWDKSLASFADDLAKGKRTLDENTAAGRQNTQAIVDRLQQAQQDAVQRVKDGESIAAVTATYNQQEQALITLGTKQGLSATAQAALITQYHLTPAEVNTVIKANAAPASAVIAAIQAQYSELEQPIVTKLYLDYVNTSGMSSQDALDLAAKQRILHPNGLINDEGGVLPLGTSLVVNRTNKPEAILNAEQWNSMHRLATQGGGGGNTYNIYVQGMLSNTGDLIKAVDADAASHLARGGRLNGRGLVAAGR